MVDPLRDCLTCPKDHVIICHGNTPKEIRFDESWQVMTDYDTVNCYSCKQTVRITDEFYYSCEETCDFNLCENCATDGKGNILRTQFRLPSNYAAGSKVICGECGD